jgi:hypothetical protein
MFDQLTPRQKQMALAFVAGIATVILVVFVV